jgi:hypothetical protein
VRRFFLKKNPLLSEKRILEGRIERKSNVYRLYLHRILLSASVLYSKDFVCFRCRKRVKKKKEKQLRRKLRYG